MKRNVTSSFHFESEAGSNVQTLILELIALAGDQPEGAIVSALHEGVLVYVSAHNNPESVYAHYQHDKCRSMGAR